MPRRGVAASAASDDASGGAEADVPFDTALLSVLGCPFSKRALRYDSVARELVSPSMAVAFPVDRLGTANLTPGAGRFLSDAELDVLLLSGVIERDELAPDRAARFEDLVEEGEEPRKTDD
jgi:hypothetical protein